jgi:hypothetical protein
VVEEETRRQLSCLVEVVVVEAIKDRDIDHHHHPPTKHSRRITTRSGTQNQSKPTQKVMIHRRRHFSVLIQVPLLLLVQVLLLWSGIIIYVRSVTASPPQRLPLVGIVSSKAHGPIIQEQQQQERQKWFSKDGAMMLLTPTNGINNKNNYKNNNPWPICSLRGGEISLPQQNDDDEDTDKGEAMEESNMMNNNSNNNNNNSPLLSSVRDVVRNLLKFGDETIPPLSRLLRSCLSVVEKLIGIKVLPSKIKPMKIPKTKNSNKKKKNHKKESTNKDRKNFNSNGGINKPKKQNKKSSAEVPTITTTTTKSPKTKIHLPHAHLEYSIKH